MKKFRALREEYQDELHPVNPDEVSYVSYSKNISLDQLVDRYLMQYEKEANGQENQNIQEKTWKDEFKSFVNEADPADPAAGGDPVLGLGDPGDDAGLGMPDAGMAPAAPAEPSGPNVLPPDINIERFSELVYGLIENYENLLDPKATIMNRAEAYVAKNYSPRHAQKLVKFLETKYGIGFKDRAGGKQEFYAAGSFGDAGSSVSATPS